MSLQPVHEDLAECFHCNSTKGWWTVQNLKKFTNYSARCRYMLHWDMDALIHAHFIFYRFQDAYSSKKLTRSLLTLESISEKLDPRSLRQMPQPTRHHMHLHKRSKNWTIFEIALIGVGTKRVSIANWFIDVCYCVVQGNHRSTCVHHYNAPWFVNNSWAMEVLHVWLGQFSNNTLVVWRLLHKIICKYEFHILQQWFQWILGCF